MKLVTVSNVLMSCLSLHKDYDKGSERYREVVIDKFYSLVRKNNTMYDAIKNLIINESYKLGIDPIPMPPMDTPENEKINRESRRYNFMSFQDRLNELSRKNQREKDKANPNDWDFRVSKRWGGPMI